MTNNPTIDGVSRELIEQSATLLEAHSSGTSIESNLAADLRALLDVQAVERKEPVEKVDHPNFLEFAICDTCAAESLCCEVAPNEHLCGGCYWAPINEKADADQVAALQSTIARLEARITQLESEKEFAAATYQAARDRIAELESGRGEPIYQVQYRGEGGGGWSDAEKESYDAKVPHPKHWKTRIVYAAPPSPAAAPTDLLQRLAYALSQVGKADHLVDYDAVILAREDLRACLDATAALNTPK